MDMHAKFKQRLKYDSETGLLTWLNFGARTGQIAGSKRPDGYITIGVFGQKYLAHRVAWFLYYGKWPTPHLDHINRNRSDNRIANLHNGSVVDNAMNRRGANSNNALGARGVRQLPSGRFAVGIQGKYHGSFDTLFEARQKVRELV